MLRSQTLLLTHFFPGAVSQQHRSFLPWRTGCFRSEEVWRQGKSSDANVKPFFSDAQIMGQKGLLFFPHFLVEEMYYSRYDL